MRQWRLAVAVIVLGARALGAPDLLIADFEGTDYGDWTVEGEAFGPGPARGTLPGQMQVTGFRGRGLVNSFFHGDGTTGTLTSPAFTIQRRFINFLIGGGKYPGETCLNLLVAGQVVRTASGPNDRPGGSERLRWASWDVAELLGEKAVLQVVDRRTGGWGHVNVDHIFQSDERWQEVEKTVELTLEKRYLNFPVKRGAEMRQMRLQIGGETVREFTLELADADPEYWVFLDVSAFHGRQATLGTEAAGQEAPGLALISQDEEIKGAEDLYRERYRPQFHFTSRRGWNNDPNGLVFYRGEYHLYYQHNPYGCQWGNMHWGHAVSRDLVHWQEQPVAIHPQRVGDWVFSGSAVVDAKNTAGSKAGEEDVIVAAFTSTGRGECIAYSTDRGRTFTDFEGNPVVQHQGRDPKLIWYEPGQHWVMAVYDERGESKGIAFYTSPDLKHWEFASRIEGYYECPELFELAVDGKPSETRWVVYSANGEYSVGAFDGKTFTAESGKHRFNYGNCFYASQTFNNLPPEDGRRIQIAWGTMNFPGMPFNQMMDFPVELTLRSTEEGPRMYAEPVREIAQLHGKHLALGGQTLRDGENPLAGISGELFHVRGEFECAGAAQFGFHVRGIPVVYDVGRGQLSCLGCTAPLAAPEGKVELELLVDRASIEVFGNQGQVYMPVGVIPSDEVRSLDVFSRGGATKVHQLDVYELKSAWEGAGTANAER